MIITKESNEIREEDVKYFGNEIEKNKKVNEDFKSFNSFTWIKTNEGKKYYIEETIGKLKKRFNNFESDKREIIEDKNGKQKKALEWNCEVIREGTYKIPSNKIEEVQQAIKKHKPFTLDNAYLYFYLLNNIYKDSKNDVLVYIDIDNRTIVKINVEGWTTKEKIFDWIEEYKKNNN